MPGVWEHKFAALNQSADVIWVGMREQDDVNVSRCRACRGEVVDQPPRIPSRIRLVASVPGIDEDPLGRSGHQHAVELQPERTARVHAIDESRTDLVLRDTWVDEIRGLDAMGVLAWGLRTA